ncbi:putative tetratricopeptide-like helical domain-containing protein [Rosa chinensis]|uniref:Putative tetratricopeptide-like helical domain-containing protein n=1 Tax=Rosa chinensis TaxID=74649 RepID=A0A2P6QP63_ROSCH|nr:pentatricopeptide repeat-containing protein At3g22670, mitochondrial [Rosa chinensis]PRQ35981.1 putative tetratricopeptide-like helical domain-containing protein [Rosa chinensis]
MLTRLHNLKLHSTSKTHINALRYFLNPLCTTTEVAESPDLPSWVKFFDTNHPNHAASDDDDFVIPSLANWVETHNLNHPTKPPKLSTSDTDDLESISRILKIRYPSPENAAESLERYNFELSNGLVQRVLMRFSNDWVPALGFFIWAKRRTGYRHLPEAYNSMVDVLGKSKNFELMWDFVEEMDQIGDGFVSLETMTKVFRRLAKPGKHREAIEAFRGMERFGLSKDVVALNTLLNALVKERSVELAQEAFLEFKESIPVNAHSFNVLIHGWCKNRKLDIARNTMEEMERHGFRPDVFSYTCLVEAYCSDKDFRKVDEVLSEMKGKACEPNAVTYTIVMHALGKAREITKALEVYELMKGNGVVPDVSFYSSLIYILGKAGRLKDVQEVVEDMTKQGVKPDAMTYNTLISCACEHAQEEAALKLLKKMEEDSCKPDVQTYAPLLKMCCRKKRMKVLYFLLDHMFKNDISIDAGTYALLVRGMCKNGKLKNACSFFEEMVLKSFVPKDSTYKMLIEELQGKSMEKEKKHIEELMLQAKEQGNV